MIYIITDPDEESREGLKKILDGCYMLDCQGSFSTFKATENSIRDEFPDIAFIRMGHAELNDFRLASEIRDLNPFVKVIFFSNQVNYAVEAFEYGADGFLLTPFHAEKIERLLVKWMVL